MKGENSSGLLDDVYDAVVMLGGFSPGNIPPTSFDEILRITKPGERRMNPDIIDISLQRMRDFLSVKTATSCGP